MDQKELMGVHIEQIHTRRMKKRKIELAVKALAAAGIIVLALLHINLR